MSEPAPPPLSVEVWVTAGDLMLAAMGFTAALTLNSAIQNTLQAIEEQSSWQLAQNSWISAGVTLVILLLVSVVIARHFRSIKKRYGDSLQTLIPAGFP